MPWYVLLIVALVGLAVIIGALVYVALKGWRLAKHGMAVSRRITPLVDGLSHRADEISVAAEHLSADGESLTVSISKLQVSLARLQVVTQHASTRPWRRTTSSRGGSPATRATATGDAGAAHPR